MPSQRATDQAVYDLLSRSPELQGRLEAFLRDHPDQMPKRHRQVLMRSVEKAARDPRVGLALRDDAGDCAWWLEPVDHVTRGAFVVPVARGTFDLEADCRRAKPQAAAAPEPTGWRWLVVVLWARCVLLTGTFGSAVCHFWRTHITAARVSRRARRTRLGILLIAIADLQRHPGCGSAATHRTIPQPHTASRGPPLPALLWTFTRWPVMRTVCIARVRRQPVAVRG